MNLIALTCSAILCLQSKGADPFVVSVRDEKLLYWKSNLGKEWRVVLVSGKFRSKGRLLKAGKSPVLVDGRPAWGTDGDLPLREIRSFMVEIDGKPIRIDSKLWTDCFEPNWEHANSIPTHLSFKPNPDGRSLVISALNSDGAGSYAVTWSIQANGQVSRKIKSLA